jgi:hypothetical protein
LTSPEHGRGLPRLFPGAKARQNNIIVRPYGDKVHFVQLDDLDEARLGGVRAAAFLTLQTSPGNHQAWVAVSDRTNTEDAKDFARRLRKGVGRGRHFRFWRHADCRHHQLQAQI